MRLLEGQVTEPDDSELDDLRAEVRELKAALADANRQVLQARREAAGALASLRKQLNPLYRALQQVFGELDAVGVSDEPAAANQRVSAVWENWKDKLGIGPAKCIDALLLHGELTTQQLSVATGYHRNTVPQYVSALHRAGLINKNGGRFSLKSL